LWNFLFFLLNFIDKHIFWFFFLNFLFYLYIFTKFLIKFGVIFFFLCYHIILLLILNFFFNFFLFYLSCCFLLFIYNFNFHFLRMRKLIKSCNHFFKYFLKYWNYGIFFVFKLYFIIFVNNFKLNKWIKTFLIFHKNWPF